MADRSPRSPIEALQIALIAALKADNRLLDLVHGRIYDEPPSDKDRATPPYCYLGPVNLRRISDQASASRTGQVTFRVFAISTDYGRVEAWDTIDAVTAALHGVELQLVAPFSTMGDPVLFITAGDVAAPLNPKSTFADFTTTIANI